jgi:hypothetical protein
MTRAPAKYHRTGLADIPRFMLHKQAKINPLAV